MKPSHASVGLPGLQFPQLICGMIRLIFSRTFANLQTSKRVYKVSLGSPATMMSMPFNPWSTRSLMFSGQVGCPIEVRGECYDHETWWEEDCDYILGPEFSNGRTRERACWVSLAGCSNLLMAGSQSDLEGLISARQRLLRMPPKLSFSQFLEDCNKNAVIPKSLHIGQTKPHGWVV